MTSQQPTQFENYPHEEGEALPAAPVAPEPAPRQVWEQPPGETSAPSPQLAPASTYRAPLVSAPQTASGDPSRRSVFGLFGAVGVGVVVLVVAARSGTRTTEDDSTDPYGDAGTYTADSGETVDVGDYSTDVPDGWACSMTSGDAGDDAVFTAGPNRVAAYAFTPNADDVATDQLPALTKKRMGAFTGTIGEPVDDSTADLQLAKLSASGKLAGKKARLIADLWMPSDGNALLTVQVLIAQEGSDIANAAQDIVDALSSDF